VIQITFVFSSTQFLFQAISACLQQPDARAAQKRIEVFVFILLSFYSILTKIRKDCKTFRKTCQYQILRNFF